MDKLHPKLDSVLHCLFLNGYSVFSPIDDIFTHQSYGCEDESIKLFREGVECDALDICARLRRIPSGPERVEFGRVQRTCSRLRVSVWPATSTKLPA